MLKKIKVESDSDILNLDQAVYADCSRQKEVIRSATAIDVESIISDIATKANQCYSSSSMDIHRYTYELAAEFTKSAEFWS